MPSCESCRAEYEAGTEVCAECNVPLVDSLPDAGGPAELTDLYVCYDAGEAERLAEVLVSDGIEVMVRDRSSTAFPMNVGEQAKQIIAVGGSDLARARELIKTAVADGVVSPDGKLFDG
jgi:hypothetical protein